MISLSQGMYSDFSCNTFGLMYSQHRTDEVIRNAGWFNKAGQKLGWGDLSLKDLDNIAALLPDGELFIILSEADSNWNMPSNIDRFSPGINYVMQNAIWLVSAFKATNDTIYLIKDSVVINGINHHTDTSVFYSNPTMSYFEITRDKLFKAVGYGDGAFVAVERSLNSKLKAETYYGLPVYEFQDGEMWAVAKDGEIHSAMTLKIRDNLHSSNLKTLKNFLDFSDDDINILMNISDNFGYESNHLFKVILGTYLNNFVNDEALRRSPGDVLNNFDGKECLSDDIEGLPRGHYAYRIDC